MSKRIESLMQEALAGIDAGLTPEECLSAWPERRAELEPLLRQALLLRVAYASAPREEFRQRARDKLMFVAGREARQALAAEPDPHFVRTTRQRFLNAAGASAQESLRAVPPPRLAFWVNARRRLLEAASAGPAAAPRGMSYALRMGFSAAAVLVLALTVAGMAYFTSASAKPTVGQELAALEEQIQQIEQKAEAGLPVAPEVHLAVASKLANIAEKIGPNQTQSAVVAQELIERQKKAVADSPVAPQVQAQLAPVEERVVRIAAAHVPATLEPTAPGSSAAAASGASPVTAATAAPSATSRPAPTATLAPLTGNQARLRLLPGDTGWSEFSTPTFTIELPSSWTISGVSFGADGLAQMDTNRLFVSGSGVSLNINVRSGEIQALIDGVLVLLRSDRGDRMLVPDLVAVAGGERALILTRILDSVEHEASPTATPTSTPTRTPPSPTPRP
ncbi:MAG TPA: hypothetical protein VNN10_00475 [Dehalococcoidia bacterium]|nr:hypothetical protein [Dehalococcoidia bacterium]